MVPIRWPRWPGATMRAGPTRWWRRSLAPGFDADLIAVDGDPLTDITALQRPVAVLVSGELVPR